MTLEAQVAAAAEVVRDYLGKVLMVRQALVTQEVAVVLEVLLEQQVQTAQHRVKAALTAVDQAAHIVAILLTSTASLVELALFGLCGPEVLVHSHLLVQDHHEVIH
jgi:hypothetical protein